MDPTKSPPMIKLVEEEEERNTMLIYFLRQVYCMLGVWIGSWQLGRLVALHVSWYEWLVALEFTCHVQDRYPDPGILARSRMGGHLGMGLVWRSGVIDLVVL